MNVTEARCTRRETRCRVCIDQVTSETAEATTVPGGQEAIQLRVAEQYIGEFGKVITNADTIILPANVSDVAAMITTAMQVIGQRPGGPRS